MNKCFRRLVLVTGTAAILTACGGNKETKDALDKANALEQQKQYQDANNVLLEALRSLETKIRSDAASSVDQEAKDSLTAQKVDATDDNLTQARKDVLLKKVESNPEILTLERAQIPLYLHVERADLASAVYADILDGHPGDTVVYDLLHDKDPLLRTGAARIVGLAEKPNADHGQAITALAGETKDPDQSVRRSAVVALGSIKDAGAVPPLIDALKDSYWDVRSEAANGLGQENDGRAVKPLLDALADPDSTVQSSAENALLFLCRQPGTSVRADDIFSRLNDPHPKVAMISAVCLALLKDARAVPVLLKMLDSSDQTTRLDAVKGLGEAGDPSVIPTLRQTLKDSDLNIRGWSVIGLGNLKDEGSLADLQAIAADDTQPATIRAAANLSVSKITGEPAPSSGP